MFAVETDAELAFAAAGKPADTAASQEGTAVQEAAAGTLSALKTAAEGAAAAVHGDTAAYKHPEVAGAAGEDGDAVNATAVISSLPAVAAEALYAVAEAVQGGPEPVKSQGRFHVSVLLLVCGYQIH